MTEQQGQLVLLVILVVLALLVLLAYKEQRVLQARRVI